METSHPVYLGAFLTILILIAGFFIKRKYFPEKVTVQPVLEASPAAPVEQFPQTSPLPQEIIGALKKLPPFQMEEVQKTYIGQKVRWRGILGSVYPHAKEVPGSPFTYVSLRPETEDLIVIATLVLIEQFPQLKIAHRGAKIGMTGIIGGVEGMMSTFHIKDAHFTILD